MAAEIVRKTDMSREMRKLHGCVGHGTQAPSSIASAREPHDGVRLVLDAGMLGICDPIQPEGMLSTSPSVDCASI
ncbi:hypothetical protein [Rhizobium gallicum]|uniref:hypothetical protein n=1 Tax=Rhizobium gallicum TaxID=56730 RepID=UPI001EF8ECCC|nr:hypothetical protein [Rhizobium gallicum]ULJ76259.1 hypothetical protein L2W42_28015 [Rhizobium gallicum]